MKKVTLIGIILVLMLTGSGFASQIINYQGYLTDSDGTPVTGSDVQMTFRIYDDSGGDALWSSGLLTVAVNNGMFSHNLGSSVELPDSVFIYSPLYLGIQIGTDTEISPRTLLTSAPSSAVATNLVGLVETQEGGKLNIMNDIGKYMGIEPSPFNDAGQISFYDPSSELPNNPLIRMGFEPSPFLEMTESSPGIYDPMIRMGTEPSPFHQGYLAFPNVADIRGSGDFMNLRVHDSTGEWTSEFSIFDYTVPPEPVKTIEIKSAPSTGGSIKMFQPQPEPPGRLALSMNSSPTEGTAIYGFNPQPEPPGFPAFELGVNPPAKGSGSYFRLNSALTEYIAEPAFEVSVNATETRMLIDDNRPNGTKGSINLNAGLEETGIIIVDSKPDGAEGSINLNAGLEEVGIIINDKTPTRGIGPSIDLRANNDSGRVIITGLPDATGGGAPVISMVTRADSAKVGIGTSTPVEALHVIGNIACTGSMYVITETKLKRNIDPIINAIDKVMALNGVYYNYRYDEYPELKLAETDQVGLLAEDVEKALPEIVHIDGNGTKLVDYTKLAPLLIEAIKEQQDVINKLQERIEVLENN